MDAAGVGPQVSPEHYLEASYCSAERFASLSEQYRSVRALNPGTVVEIGEGVGLLAFLLRRSGLTVTSVDIDPDLKPDVVGTVTALPFPDGAADLVTCFEVLEHLPFADAATALAEIRRVTRQAALVSLPDPSPMLRLFIPPTRWIGRLTLPWPFWWPRRHVFAGEHHWEVNRRGFELRRVRRVIEAAGFVIEATWRPWDCPYHRFFHLTPA